MADFMTHFFFCNIFISGFIGILLTARYIFKNSLTSRMRYHLWFLLLGFLAVPFIPYRLDGFSKIFSLSRMLEASAAWDQPESPLNKTSSTNLPAASGWMNDFAISVNRQAASVTGWLLSAVWIAGILGMILLTVKSSLRLRALKQSALPLQNEEVRIIYAQCLKDLSITKKIPVYSTAYLKSPLILGLAKPAVYLPIHLILEHPASDIRYILLHELQHYRHKDVLVGYLMNLAGILYWFHPLVWLALKEMRGDREIACDTSVLQMLTEDSYEDYGNTLIRFAEKISLASFPFAAGLGGNMRQMRRRIQNIACYRKPDFQKKCLGTAAFILTAALLLELSPLLLSAYAAPEDRYQWNAASETVGLADLSAYFKDFEGSFVLYDLKKDSWTIHDIEHAVTRVSPDSTYKIYDALFALEEGIITPDNSYMAWDHKVYPYDAWNASQTLDSAMQASVNWYFQAMDEQLGKARISRYIQTIGYGSQNISGRLSSYWMESSLQISPVEQVQLLTELHRSCFGFAQENAAAVKDAMRLSSFDTWTLYGKTGTGNVGGQNTNGWFVGYVESTDNTYFFATNIKADANAAGSSAAKLTIDILADMNIFPGIASVTAQTS